MNPIDKLFGLGVCSFAFTFTYLLFSNSFFAFILSTLIAVVYTIIMGIISKEYTIKNERK